MPASRTQRVYQRVFRALTAVERAHERWLSAEGSSGARFAVLTALADAGQPLTPSDISATTGRSPNAISPLLGSLEGKGLIKRSPNPDDRRSFFLTLTAAGRRHAVRLRREERAFMQALLGGRRARDLDALDRGLEMVEQRAVEMQRSR